MENIHKVLVTQDQVNEFVDAMDNFTSALLDAMPELEGMTLEDINNNVEIGNELAKNPTVAFAALSFEKIANSLTTEQKEEIIKIILSEVDSENE